MAAAQSPAWQHLWSVLGLAEPGEEHVIDLIARYGEAQRAYHTMTHIDECLAHFAEAVHLAQAAATVEAAIWFHDVIYDPKRSDNEEASACWAAGLLQAAGASATTSSTIQELIVDTAHRRPPRTADGALLVDIDLAILGAPPHRFDEYEAQIRHEYSWVPWPTFAQRRTAILEQFLARTHIYQTAHFQERFEQTARQNLTRSIAQLTRTA